MNFKKYIFVVFVITGIIVLGFYQSSPGLAVETVKDTELPPYLVSDLIVNITQANSPDTDYNTSTFGWGDDFADTSEFTAWDQVNIDSTVISSGNSTITLTSGKTFGSIILQLGNGTFTANINRYIFQSIEVYIPNKTATSNQFIIKTPSGLYNSSIIKNTGFVKYPIHGDYFSGLPEDERVTGVGLRVNGDGSNANATTFGWLRIYNTYAGDEVSTASGEINRINLKYGTYRVQLSARTQEAKITPVTLITTSSGEVTISAIGETIIKKISFPVFKDGIRIAQSSNKGAKISWESVERETTTLNQLLKDKNVQMVNGKLSQSRTLFDPRLEKVGTPKINFVRLEPSRNLKYSKFTVGSDNALTVFQWVADALGVAYEHIIFVDSQSQEIEHEIPYNKYEGSQFLRREILIDASPSITAQRTATIAARTAPTTLYTKPAVMAAYTPPLLDGYVDRDVREEIAAARIVEPKPIIVPPPPPPASSGLYDVSGLFIEACGSVNQCSIGNTNVKAVQTDIQDNVVMSSYNLNDSVGYKTNLSPDVSLTSDIAQEVDSQLMLYIIVGALVIVGIVILAILFIGMSKKGRQGTE